MSGKNILNVTDIFISYLIRNKLNRIINKEESSNSSG